MNNKTISHQEAVDKIKELEVLQRMLKAFRNNFFKYKDSQKDASEYQSRILQNKKEINMLLSIIYWHKKAKKLYHISKKTSP